LGTKANKCRMFSRYEWYKTLETLFSTA